MLVRFRNVAGRSPCLRRSCLFTAVAVKRGASPKYDAIQDLVKERARLLRVVQKRVDERAMLQRELSDDMPSQEEIVRLKHLKECEALHDAWTRWKATMEQLNDTASLLEDPDPTMHNLAVEEIDSLSSTLADMIENEFPKLLVPPSKTANLGALMELKSGVGGSESSLFLAELLRMYQRLANNHRWQATVLSKHDLESGGIKEAIVEFKGGGAYDSLRRESGVHRVQRVPATESSGRTHTSTVAVVVLPLIEEQDNGQEELFAMADVKLEVMRARGAGGQHVNKTESAVRLTHIPSGITVSMQDERSQHQNRRRAFQILRSRLMDIKLTREMEERRLTRRNLVKTADRSEKIRTYNFSQDRVTDHRISLTMKNLPSVLEGDGIQLFIDGLKQDHAESVIDDLLDDLD